MLTAIAFGLLAIGYIIPLYSGAQILIGNSNLTIASETAYYFISDRSYAFYFPTRLKNYRLTQVCLLIHHARREVRCTFVSPRDQFEIDGEFQERISVTWQMKYSGNVGVSFLQDVLSETVDNEFSFQPFLHYHLAFHCQNSCQPSNTSLIHPPIVWRKYSNFNLRICCTIFKFEI